MQQQQAHNLPQQALSSGLTGFRKGLLQVVPNSVLVAQEEEEQRKQAEMRQNRPEVRGLAAHVHAGWQAAKQAKQPIETRMLKCHRARKGEYEPDRLAEIREQGGTDVFMMLTDEKVSAGASWVREILLSSGEQPWGIEPTAIPDLPPEVSEQVGRQVQMEVLSLLQNEANYIEQAYGMSVSHEDIEERVRDSQPQIQERFKQLYDEQLHALTKEAKTRAARTEAVMKDIVIESNFEDALDEAIDDIATFPAGFIQGPVVTKKKEIKWIPDGNGRTRAQMVEKLKLTFRHLSGYDVYPSPSATSIEDGDLFIKHRLTRKSLSALKGVPGYDEQAIRQCLSNYASGLNNWLTYDSETTRDRLEDRNQVYSDPNSKIEVLQFYGSVQGRMLIMHGVPTERIPDPLAEYDAEVWLCGSYVLKATLNGDPLGRKPVHKASFRKVPGSFWGMGIPELMEDCQTAANAAARNLINNMGLASGPQVGVDVGAMPEGEDIEELYPWKIWQFDMKNAQGSRPPIWFFQPNALTAELMKVYEWASTESDTKTGIPKYSYGTGKTQGAAGTSSGLAMLINNAARGIKDVVRNVDRGMICPPIQYLFDWVMMYMPHHALQGDSKVIARGSSSLVAKEMQTVRRNEAMQIILGSPAVLNMIGPEGLAEFLRKFFAGLDVGADDIVPRKEVIAAQNNKDMIIQQLATQLQQLQQAIGGGQGQQMLPQGQQQEIPIGRNVDAAGNVQGGMEANMFPGG